MTMPTSAIVPTCPAVGEQEEKRQPNSKTVPQCAPQRGVPRRAQVLRVVAVELALERPCDRFQGVLLIITETTNGKWWFSFEEAAPHQMKTKTNCQPTIRLSAGNSRDEQHRRRRPPGAPPRKGTLSRRPSSASSPSSTAIPAVSSLPSPRGSTPDGDQEDAAASTAGVQSDVDRGAAGAARERDLVGPRSQPDGAGPQPVEDAAYRRREAERQRHRARRRARASPRASSRPRTSGRRSAGSTSR